MQYVTYKIYFYIYSDIAMFLMPKRMKVKQPK